MTQKNMTATYTDYDWLLKQLIAHDCSLCGKTKYQQYEVINRNGVAIGWGYTALEALTQAFGRPG